MTDEFNDQNQSNGWVVGLIVVILIGVGIFIWDGKQARKECEDMAVAAAVDTYPMDEYPNTSERSALQDDYKLRYIQGCN